MSISNTELFGSKDHEILWIHNITLHCKITRKLLRNQSVASFPSDDFSYVVAVELERTSKVMSRCGRLQLIGSEVMCA